jgi:hypothetical protein
VHDEDEFHIYPIEETLFEKILIWGFVFIAVVTGLVLLIF